MIKIIKYGLVLGFLVVVSVFVLQKSYAIDSSWLSGSITLNEEKTYTLPQDIGILDSIGTNSVSCTNKQIKVNYTQNTTACMYSNGIGYYGGGYYLFGNASIAGTVKSQMSTSSKLFFTSTQRIVELVSASGGYRVYIYDSLAGIATAKQPNGSIIYTLPNNPRLIKNTDGSALTINYNTFKLSENNEWAIADTFGYIGFVRIDIASGEVFSFTDSLYDAYSLNAVSDNGVFAVLSTQAPQKRLLVYDLSNCTKQSLVVNRCRSSDVLQKIILQKPSFYSVVHAPKFINDGLLEAYGTYDRVNPSNRKIGIFTVSPDGQTLTKTNYLALGDSFSSGEGIKSYRPETNFADNRCHQSIDSYGYLLHDSLPSTGSFGSVACSGAKIKDVIISDRKTYNNNNPQAKNKSLEDYDSEIINNFLPGYRGQLKFVNNLKPEIITLSMGGNDIGFSDILKKCVLSFGYNDCYPTYEDRKELVMMINNQYPRLRDMYLKLKTEAAPDARIYIIGYPQISKSSGNCALNVHFSEDEVIFGNQLVSYLNYVIKSAANDGGVLYVDVENSFEGHRLCEAPSYEVAVNGLTYGDGGPINGVGPIAKESYHPNKLGHQLFANTITTATSGLTAPMPSPNTSSTLVVPSDANIPLLANAPHTNRTLKTMQYMQNMTTEVAIKSALLNIQIAQPFVFKPSSSVKISIHSDPVELGSFATTAEGGLESSVTLPDSITTGYHTLFIEGKNMADEDIALTEILYVAASETDIDGNGVTDGQQACVRIDSSGVDVDKDRVDDACDEFIDQAPPEPEPTPPPETPPVDQNPTQPTDNPQDQNNNPTEETPPVIVDVPITPPVDVIPPEKLNDKTPTTMQNTTIATPSVSINTAQPDNQTQSPTTTLINTQSTENQPVPEATQSQEITKVAGISTPTPSLNKKVVTKNSNTLFVSIGIGFISLFCVALLVFRRTH